MSTSPVRVVEPALVWVPADWFHMGHPEGLDCERPVHRVWVDAFSLAATQVTNAEYAPFLEATGTPPPPQWNDPNFSDPQQPVVAVSWFEAVDYCEWLSQVTGRKYRLPSEAEWEKGARGTLKGTLYPWGDTAPQSLPDYHSRWLNGPEKVGGVPNSIGLYNMCDNVHEWCSDWFDAEYYRHSPERNPRGPEEGIRRSSRGGSWRHHIKASRCHTRSSIPPEFHYADYGFRVASSSG